MIHIRSVGIGYSSSATPYNGYLSDIFRYNLTSQMWTWVGGPAALGGYYNIGVLGIESADNKLIAVNGHSLFAGDNPVRLFTWGGEGCATSDSNGDICRLQERYHHSS